MFSIGATSTPSTEAPMDVNLLLLLFVLVVVLVLVWLARG
jgi:hypothetical protein